MSRIDADCVEIPVTLSGSTCAIAESIVLLACARLYSNMSLTFVPVGSLQHGVVFILAKFRPRKSYRHGLTVRRRNRWSTTTVWSAKETQRLRYITLRATYPDLTESQRPLRIRHGKRYEVFVVHQKGAKSLDVLHSESMRMGTLDKVPWGELTKQMKPTRWPCEC